MCDIQNRDIHVDIFVKILKLSLLRMLTHSDVSITFFNYKSLKKIIQKLGPSIFSEGKITLN